MTGDAPYRAWWFDQALRHERAPDPAPLRGELEVDVCIVGGGYTGLWTAILIKQTDPDRKVVVVEQELCGHGASGANGGCMLTLATKYLSLIRFYGEGEAARLVQASEQAVAEIHDFAQTHGIECDLRLDGALYMATNQAQVGVMDSVLRALDKSGINSWEEMTPPQAAAIAGTQDLLEAHFSRAAGSVQPALLVRGLARVAREMGVVIHEGTPMRRLERGVVARVVTDQGSVRAKKVVLATNAWITGLVPEFGRTITVVSSDMGITQPCPELLDRIGLDHGASVCDSRIFVHYYHATGDGRLLLGKGGNTFAYGSRMIPSFFEPSTYEWQIRGALNRFFPELCDVGLEACWNGASDRSTTGFPFFGPLPAQPNVFYGYGYSGNGVTQSLLGGKILRSLVLDMDDEWSRAGFVGGPRGRFPPEPIRWLGAMLVRNGIRRKEAAEDSGRVPNRVDTWLARFAQAAGKADSDH
ncbi:MAG TPA: FAD-dependent oxidoreductase [Candidatus Latescibacteria bacterium]|jgi:putative aminophosphonate oxidoreductase|nr:FAD-dependent oxidoreductase [Gemmatimonadaceae bacterium]MDP6017841.1 FAD-dependent oxidoreductase [Candidatus Latescibacterota bacterium]HJP32502.1 FAD-dependent oxidoreductase [Candidatus Latescibacterota bacterium]